MICFGISVNADNGKTCSVKLGDMTIGYVTAWIDSSGILWASNNAGRSVTVTIKYECNSGTKEKYVTLPAKDEPVKVDVVYSTCKVKSVENPMCQ